MPWNWNGRGRKSVEVGGDVGTVQEANVSKTWPNYEAAYLANRLAVASGETHAQAREYAHDIENGDKYTVALKIKDDAARNAYLDKISTNYKQEADECLKKEFADWLEGRHEANVLNPAYKNHSNQMKRKFVFQSKAAEDGNERNAPGGGTGSGNVTDRMDNWKPTWWGQASLTHLPGVREYLREQAVNANEHDFAMNLLAEFGPQNIDQAWAYFKHWVKGRPLSEASCLHIRQPDTAGRAPLKHIAPEEFNQKRSGDEYAEAEAVRSDSMQTDITQQEDAEAAALNALRDVRAQIDQRQRDAGYQNYMQSQLARNAVAKIADDEEINDEEQQVVDELEEENIEEMDFEDELEEEAEAGVDFSNIKAPLTEAEANVIARLAARRQAAQNSSAPSVLGGRARMEIRRPYGAPTRQERKEPRTDMLPTDPGFSPWIARQAFGSTAPKRPLASDYIDHRGNDRRQRQ